MTIEDGPSDRGTDRYATDPQRVGGLPDHDVAYAVLGNPELSLDPKILRRSIRALERNVRRKHVSRVLSAQYTRGIFIESILSLSVSCMPLGKQIELTPSEREEIDGKTQAWMRALEEVYPSEEFRLKPFNIDLAVYERYQAVREEFGLVPPKPN